MKKVLMSLVVVSLCCWGASSFAEKQGAKDAGEAGFNAHCAMCHPAGGNIVNPKKTLSKKDREANTIKTEADIVKYLRKPGPGMMVFDAVKLPDKDAAEIAKYIIKTFK